MRQKIKYTLLLLTVVSFSFHTFSQSDTTVSCFKKWNELHQDSAVYHPEGWPDYEEGMHQFIQVLLDSNIIQLKDTEIFSRLILSILVDEKGKVLSIKQPNEINSCYSIEYSESFLDSVKFISGKCWGEPVKSILILKPFIHWEK